MDVVDIKNGLLAAINGAGVALSTVEAISTRSISESGEVVVIKPAALVLYGGSQLTTRNLTATLYDDPSRWEVLIVTEDLSGGDEAAAEALTIIDALKKKLGGLKLSAASGRANVKLDGIELVSFQSGSAIYSMLLLIESDFQTSPE